MDNNTPSSEKNSGFIRGLGLIDSIMLIMGSMIGSAIFIAPSLMATYIPSAWLIVSLWLIGGCITLFGALSFAELASSMPKAGGQYVFIREAFNPMMAFIYGWSLFFVIQVGFIAGVAIAFTKYLGVFFPFLSETNFLFTYGILRVNTVQIVAIVSILALTGINIFGIRLGAWVQNIFTFSKIGGLLFLVVAAFALGQGNWYHLCSVGDGPSLTGIALLGAVAVMMSKALFAYDAWNAVTFTAEEVREPEKNLPRALIAGTALTTLIYLSATVAYFYIIPADRMAHIHENRIAAVVMEHLLGTAGLTLITLIILISTLGCNNGLILSGARVYYAMANDGLFFRQAGYLHPRYHTPVWSLILQGLWASVLTLSGTYSDLLTYTVFASLLFNAITVAGLFRLRQKYPNKPSPFRVPVYPIIPLSYVMICLFFIIYLIIGDFKNTGLGMLIIATGLPAYWIKKLWLK